MVILVSLYLFLQRETYSNCDMFLLQNTWRGLSLEPLLQQNELINR